MTDPGKTVLYSMLITSGSTVGSSVLPESYGGKGQLPPFKLLFGTALSYAGLAILADYAPGLAVPLSVALAVTALTYYGIPLLERFAQQ